jgi:hypothetical protein
MSDGVKANSARQTGLKIVPFPLSNFASILAAFGIPRPWRPGFS